MTRSLSVTEAIAALPEAAPMTLGGLLAAFGSRAHGATLLVLALPEAVPLPVPSAAAVLGVPLVLVSAHLALVGESGTLPRRILDLPVPPALLRALHRIGPWLARGERLSRPRLGVLTRHERLLALVCLYLSTLLLLPLPFFNVPPALSLVLIAWGMLQRDGVAVLLGLGGTAVTTALLVGVVDGVRALLG